MKMERWVTGYGRHGLAARVQDQEPFLVVPPVHCGILGKVVHFSVSLYAKCYHALLKAHRSLEEGW